MNYEKKYEEALERARVYHTGGSISDAHITEVIFPELKESKDDRIVRCLLNYFNHVRYNGLDLKGTDIDEVIAWLEKQGEKKPTENVEIKFCEGDKVVSNQDGKVYTVGTAYYVIGDGEDICLHDTDGNHLWTNRDDLNNDYHLWSINDAKDGDVLVYETDEVEWIFIYREIVPAASEVPHDLLRYYFLLEGNYFNWNGVSAMITDDYKLYLKPATKEQQDTLFAKMKEAGYEWDSEKKELKKIEVKTLNADKVIAWLVANICDFEHYVKLFKKDFGL